MEIDPPAKRSMDYAQLLEAPIASEDMSPCRFTIPGRHTDGLRLINQHHQTLTTGDVGVEQLPVAAHTSTAPLPRRGTSTEDVDPHVCQAAGAERQQPLESTPSAV